MSQIYGGDFLTVMAAGSSVATSGTASAATAIPNCSDGNKPRFIRVASRNEAYIKLGTGSVVATTSDVLVQPADAVILVVPLGITHFSVIQGVSAGLVNVVPLENI